MVVAFAVLLTACVCVVFAGLLEREKTQESRALIRVGIVGDLTDSYFNMGVFVVQNFDSSKAYLEFVQLEEEQAASRLNDGQIAGYIRIPTGFVEDAMQGDKVRVQYISGNSPSALGPLLMQEIADIISNMVISAQSGVYGFLSLAEAVQLENQLRRSLTDRLTLDYVQQILQREEIYSIEYLGYGAGLRFGDYYFCVFFLLCLMLCALPCAGFMVRSDLALGRCLVCKGQGIVRQIAAEFLAYFLLIAVSGVLLLGVAGAILGPRDTGILQGLQGAGDYLRLGLRLLPAVLLISAMQFLMYELVRHIIGGVFLQVLSLIVLAYVSGYIFPLYSLPRALQILSPLLPTGMALNFAAGTVKGGASPMLPILYALGLLALSGVIRTVKLRYAHET